MANLRSSKKDIRRTQRRSELNGQKRSEIRTFAKGLLKAIKAKEVASATTLYSKYSSLLDKAVKKDLIHKKNANRHKSRMAAKLNSIGKSA